MTDPVSFRDPYYADLDNGVEAKLGLPRGLLASVRLNGEKSDADEVSKDGGRGVYQITPATRQSAISDYGIDPYLNARNASEVAGRLLKDSLDRNRGDVASAVGEYAGGTDRNAWGPKTQAYIDRVTTGHAQAQSTFDRALEMKNAQQAPSQIGAIYQAYKSGQMSPQDRADFEADVKAGKMMLPDGGTLDDQQQAGPQLPQGVLDAYQQGRMSPQDASAFEQDVQNGAWAGLTPQNIGRPPEAPGFIDRMKEAVTGEQRATQETQTMPEWTGMPELNSMSMASLKTALGTLVSSPKETAQIIVANNPGVQVKQDAKGNYLLRSAQDGQWYAIPPGFSAGDVPRALGGILAFTPAGRASTIVGAGLKAGATQAAIEGTQAATGGTFDLGDVAGATLLGGAVPAAARVIDMAAAPVTSAARNVAQKLGLVDATARGVIQAPESAAPGTVVAGSVGQVAETGAAAASAQPVKDMTATVRKVGQQGESAVPELADLAAPNQKMVQAAERLGIADYLQSDHVTTNDAYRQVLGVLKSNPLTTLAQTEKAGLAKAAERASDLIDEIGGTNDLSGLSADVKEQMRGAHEQLLARENELWNKLRDTIPPTMSAPARNTMDFIEKRTEELGGSKNLSPMERSILTKLSPTETASDALTTAKGAAIDASKLSPQAQRQLAQHGASAGTQAQQPTYALLDDVRRDVGAAARQKGPFGDADTGLAKKLYGLLTQDQETVAESAGAGDLVEAAKAATGVRKGMEDDLSSLFGKQIDSASIVTKLGTAMKGVGTGDTSKLLMILKAVPDDMKQDVVASGLATIFRNASTRGEINFTTYAKWFENLLRNRRAFNAVMTNLPASARKQLADLYRVSKGISESTSARVKTGLRTSVMEELKEQQQNKGAEAFVQHLFGAAVSKGLWMLGPHAGGIGMVLASALQRSKQPVLQAIDQILTSPEFAAMARSAPSTPARAASARAVANSDRFKTFLRLIKQPRATSDRERWVTQAFVAANNMSQ